MAVRLKDRTRQIPNGFRFLQPETNWEPMAWSSFDSICRQLTTHRQGNPWLAKKYNWSLTQEGIANEVDFYNAKVCQAQGWNDFILEDNGPAPNFQTASLSPPNEAVNVAGGSKIKKAVSGLKLLTDWLGSGLKPVNKGLAENRAKVCRGCPMNQLGDFWQRMEGAAAAELRTLIEVKSDLDLHLTNEDKLHSCMGCDCWMPLKVWVPLNHILENTDSPMRDRLHKDCWIIKEQ